MPTYEYRCPEGHEFEKFFRTISGAPTSVNCPTCGAVAAREMSSGGGLLFKGSGFYLTDYGKNAHANKGQKPASADAGTSEGGSAPSVESKGSSESPAAGGGAASGSGQPSSGASNPGAGSGSGSSNSTGAKSANKGSSSKSASKGGGSSSGGSGKTSKE